ncbi:MAG: DUF1616 domain-containing protein [Methanothrix sp.]|uniref:DUF1616 domain-containing protein n=1 Tax=Methanothrix sp. TaxID=90426 RepID=UPI00247CB7B6|nr:DUF1616 domain-containing protein [Methanothrix sp.]
MKEIPRDAALTFMLLFIGAAGAYLGVPLVAFPIVLILPGYALSVALFPRKDDLDPIERLVMSIGLNVSLVCMLAVGTDALGMSLWNSRLLIHVAIATAVLMIVSMLRRRGDEDAYDLKLPEIWISVKRAVPILFLVMAIVIVLSMEQERPVELYLTDQNGDVPSCSEMSDVRIVVANHAGKASYRLDIIGDGRTLSSHQFALDGESIWSVNLSSKELRNRSRVEITLYSDGDPIRRVHLLTKS